MISETKIDGYFLIGNFVIDRYSTPHRLDQHSNGVRILSSVRETIPFYLILPYYYWKSTYRKLLGGTKLA